MSSIEIKPGGTYVINYGWPFGVFVFEEPKLKSTVEVVTDFPGKVVRTDTDEHLGDGRLCIKKAVFKGI